MGAFFSLRGKTPVKVLFAGLDSAGKTTIMHRMKLGPDKPDVNITTMPTLSFNSEVLDYRRMRLSIWDLGGQDTLRTYWRHHFTGTQAVVYVVDSNDVDRIEQSAAQLHSIMGDRELRFACLLVLANKSDLPFAVGLEELTRRMRLEELKRVEWHVIRTCATTGEGLADALQWLSANAKPL